MIKTLPGLLTNSKSRRILTFTVVGIAFLSVVTLVQARFINTRNQLLVDGVVEDKMANSFVVATSGTDPITIQVNRRTHFTGHDSFSTLQEGDTVHVVARVDDQNNARLVRIEHDETGYGTAGDRVMVTEGRVIAKGANSFEIETDAAQITFAVNSSTRFYHTNFASLHVNDRVKVMGTDSGTQFIAKKVFKRR